ncbi:unnamed protein product [Adineta ricciae]|uniref:Delta-like protein n=2 Tax=Adineta ricciae TaxID=249248 RepID=A0A813XN60_ADIRI|nr:unnamed protein product [Adineta ricciae]
MMNTFYVFLVIFLQIQLISTAGKFEIELERLVNRKGLNVNGTCCNGPDRFFTCIQPCKTFMRFCLRNQNPNLDDINRPATVNNEECTYSFDETPILGGNNIDFLRLPQQANLIVLPFKFSWMGDFVLRIDIFNDKTYDGQPYPGSARELILSTTIRSSIYPNSSWQYAQTIDSSLTSHEFSFRYRVSCATNFYGSQCSRFCSPLSSHSRCDPQTGEIICQQGWTGVDCNKAICRAGCQHGHCLNQPNQCICHQGWTGEKCQVPLQRLMSIPKPKVSCHNGGKFLDSKCQCPTGFQGSLCEERICFNGGLSSPSKCVCPPGYEGKQCEIETQCPICRNNGRCEDGKCLCPKEFTGQYCEIDVRLIQKQERKIFSIELLILFIFILLFLSILMIISCLYYKSSNQKRKQLQQIKEITFDKIWTIENSSTNIFKESKEKVIEKNDINAKLKQTDVQASLV